MGHEDYSPEQAVKYSKSRESFIETDAELFRAIEEIGGVSGNTVVDMGCGDGRHVSEIHKLGAAHVIGVDNSEAMIALTHERLKDLNDVALITADARHLPLPDESVDKVFSNFVLHYFEDSKEIFNEISRVLKSRGYFIGSFNVTDVGPGYEHLVNTSMPIRLGGKDKAVVVHNLIKSKEEIETAIQQAALTIIKTQELVHPNSVVDESFSDTDHVHKRAMMYVLQKN